MAWFSRSGRIVRALIGATEKDMKRRPVRRPASSAKPFVEPLEDRVVPATIMWKSTTQGGDWDAGANWVGGNVPGAADDAVIPAGLSTPVVHSLTVNDPVNSITSGSELDLTGGTLTVATNVTVENLPTGVGSVVLLLKGGTLSGGTVADKTVVRLSSSGGTLAGVDVAANAQIDGTQPGTNTAHVTGGLTLDGKANLGAANGSSAGQLFFDRSQNLGGAGQIVLGGAAANGVFAKGVDPTIGTGPATLFIGPNISISGDQGTVGGFFSTDSLFNAGLIEASGQHTITLQGASLTNTGTLKAAVQANLAIAPATNLTNYDVPSGTLTGGTYDVAGTLSFANPIVTNAASIELDGSSASFLDTSTATSALESFTTNAAGGSLTLNGASLMLPVSFTNQGSVVVKAGLLEMPGVYTQSGTAIPTTTLENDGSLNAAAIQNNAGVLTGTGTISGNVTNAATFAPGGPASNGGTIVVNGAFIQTTTGVYAETIAGSDATNGPYGQLQALRAALAGSIQLNFAPGFTPQLGDDYTILTFKNGSSGDFTTRKNFKVGSVALDETFAAKSMTILADASTGTALGLSAPSVLSQTAAQNITVNATVLNQFGTVSAGTVTAQIFNPSGTLIAGPMTSATVSANDATITLSLPGGLARGTYTIKASYSGASGLQASTAVSTFTVQDTAEIDNSSVTVDFSTADQPVTLQAFVTISGVPVNEGDITFIVINKIAQQIGLPVFAALAKNGTGLATATYIVPGGTPVDTYTIEAIYSDDLSNTILGDSDDDMFDSDDTNQATLTVRAAQDNWTGNAHDGDWDNPVNWSDGVPTAGISAFIGPGFGVITHARSIGDSLNDLVTQSEVDLSGGSLTFTGNGPNLTTSNGGSFLLKGAALNNATVSLGSTLTLTNFGGTLSGVTVSGSGPSFGTIDATQPALSGGSASFNFADISGDLTVDGHLLLGRSDGTTTGKLFFTRTQNLVSGGGTIFFGGAADNAIFARGLNPDGSEPATLITDVSIIAGFGDRGQIGGFFGTDSVTNDGLIDAAPGGTILLKGNAPGSSITNLDGTFQTDAGGTMIVDPLTILTNYNLGQAALDGGDFEMAGTFVLPGPLFGNEAFLDLIGPSYQILEGSTSGQNALASIAGNGGELEVHNATLATNALQFQNAGGVFILADPGMKSELQIAGSYLNFFPPPGAPDTTLKGVGAVLSAASVTFQDGSLEGSGTIIGSVAVTGNATVEAGNTGALSGVGILNIQGDYSQNSQATFFVDLAGTGAPGGAYGQLNVSGHVSLDGTIQVFLDGTPLFMPTLGDAFAILHYGSSSGDFAMKKGLDSAAPLSLDEFFVPDQSNPTKFGFLTLRTDPFEGTSLGVSAKSVSYLPITATGPSSTPVPIGVDVFNPFHPMYFSSVSVVLLDSSLNIIGTPISIGIDRGGGNGTGTYQVPAGTPAGTYTLLASYSGDGFLLGSTAFSSLEVAQAPTTTSVVTKTPMVAYSPNSQTVQLTGSVASSVGTVGEGQVTFTVFDATGQTQIGAAAFASVNQGQATATYTLPAGTLPGFYFIKESYTDTTPGNFLPADADTNSESLPVNISSTVVLEVEGPGPVTLAVDPAVAKFSTQNQTVPLTASLLSGTVPVTEGTLTFTILNSVGTVIGTPTVATVANGVATGNFTLPGGTPTGTYTIQASYTDPSGLFLPASDSSQTLTVTHIITWISPNGGDWDTGSNWSSGQVPGAGDNVVIPAINGTVTHMLTVADSALTVTSAANVVLSGGSLTVGGALSVSSGNTLLLENATLAGATLAGTTDLVLTNRGGTLSGITVSPSARIDGSQPVTPGSNPSFNFADIVGGLTLNGSVLLGATDGSSAGELFFDKTQNLTGTGSITLGRSSANAVYARGTNPQTGIGPAMLIMGSGISIVGGSGVVGGFYSTDSLSNSGTIDVGAGGSLTVQGNAVSNQGLFQVSTAATLTIPAGSNFVNYAAANSTLSGGSYVIAGKFKFPGAAIATDNALIALDGPSSAIIDSLTTNNALSGLTTIGPTGALTLDGQSLILSGPLTNNGTVTVDSTLGAAVLQVGGVYTQVAGQTGVFPSTILVDGGTLNAPAGVTLTSGVLVGSGTIVGNVVNNSLVDPGLNNDPGALVIQGTYTQMANAILTIKLGGDGSPGTNFSTLSMTGGVTLGGILTVTPVGTFVPSLGDAFTILQYPFENGDFATKMGLGVSSSVELDESFSAGTPPLLIGNLTLLADPTNGTSLGVTASPVTYSATSAQAVTIRALVFNPNQAVGTGSVEFNFTDRSGNAIAPPANASVNGGAATVTLTIPANTPAGVYFIHASYNSGGALLASTSVSALVISQAPTTTAYTGSGGNVPFSFSAQNINLSASVTSTSGTVGEGAVTFAVFDSKTNQVGALASGPVVGGVATAVLALPAGTLPGTYSVVVKYVDTTPGNFQASNVAALNSLTVIGAPTVIVPTSTIVAANKSGETVTLTANVTSTAGAVNEGSVAFSVLAGGTQIGSQVSGGSIVNGVATATYNIPAGTGLGRYELLATYTDTGGVFANSTSDGTQTFSLRNSAVPAPGLSFTTPFSESLQDVTLTATVTSPAATVNEGQVTFTVLDSNNNPIGAQVSGGMVLVGTTFASYALPASTPVGTYTVVASYTDPKGGSFAPADSVTNGTLTITAAKTTATPVVSTLQFDESAQSATLVVSVTSAAGPINEGQVSFAIFDNQNNPVGTPVIGVAVIGSTASASYTLPAGTPVGVYTLKVAYADNASPSFTSAKGSSSLIVSRATTTTVAASATLPFSESDRTLPVNATVSSAAGAVNEGTVTFALVDSGGNIIDTPVISGKVANGAAHAILDVPASTIQGFYTIRAQYNDNAGPDFQASADGTDGLTIQPAATTIVSPSFVAAYSPAAQTIQITADVTSPAGAVNEGRVAFSILDSNNNVIGSQAALALVSNGMATGNYTLPAGTPIGGYTLQAQYLATAPGDFQASTDSSHIVNIEAATAVVTNNVFVNFSDSMQNVPLSASVSASVGTVNQGTVTFTILDALKNTIGTPVFASVGGGAAATTFVLPGNTPAGTYTIQAAYVDSGTMYASTTDTSKTLSVAQQSATVTAASATATYSTSSPSVTLTATVLSPAGPVNEGTVQFTVMSGTTQIGQAATSGTVTNGAAVASYTLPSGTSAGTYTILANYFDASQDLSAANNSSSPSTLTVNPAPTTTADQLGMVAFSPNGETVVLHGSVSSLNGTVYQGTITFSVLQGTTPIGTPVTSTTVINGKASASFAVPAGTPAGFYTVMVSYSGGQNFLPSSTNTGTLVVDLPPSLAVITPTNTVSEAHDQFPFTTKLSASSPINAPLSFSAMAIGDSQLFDLESQYRFSGQQYYTNNGTTAFILQAATNNSNGNPFYLLRPSDGGLFAYAGGTYAATFANSANLIATLGPNVYTDPNLLLNAQAPLDYATLAALEQQYGFVGQQYYTNNGTTAFILRASSNNANNNPFYLISTTGGLYAYAGGTYAATFANTDNLIANLGVRVFNNPSLLTGATAPLSLYSQLYQLNQEFDLQELNGSFFVGGGGHGAEWFFSPVLNQFGQHWYTLTLQNVNGSQQAVLTAFEGYADSEVGAVVATLDPSVYSHPSWLTNATAVPDPAPGTATVDPSGNLTVNLPSAGFVGNFSVLVTTSDGLLSASQTLSVTSTDPTPTLTVQQNGSTVTNGSTLSFPHLSFPQSFTANGTSTDSADNVTISAAVSSYSPLFALEMKYHFVGQQYYTNNGVTAFILQAAGNNANGNPFYLLSTSGGLYAYAGGTYAATFANSANLIANLGTTVYADPTLLTGALPALDYTELYNLEQQFHFVGQQYYANNGVTAFILQASSNNANGNPFYLISPAGGLYAYGGGTYAATFNNPADLIATLDPQVYVTPTLLTGAQAAPGLYAQLQAVQGALDLKGVLYFVNTGVPAYVLQSPTNNANGNKFYLLLSNGDLYAYGGGTYAATVANSANLVAHLDPSVYANPALLTGARAPLADTVAGTTVTANVSGNTVTVNAPAAFVGTFQLTVTATDGINSTSETFFVTSTDTPPQPNAIPPQTASLSGPPLALTLGGSDAEHDPLTFSASVAGYSPPFNLQQQYHFQGIGYSTTSDGVSAYVLSILGSNANGNQFYLLSTTGGLYAYDGGSKFGSTFANSANLIAQLGSAVYTVPSLLTNPKPPTTPAAKVNVVGNQLTVNVAGLSVGTIFEVFVTVKDGAETTTTGFLVTVTA
jgi:hypothetical protein